MKPHQPALPSGPPKKGQPGFKSATERRNKIIKEEIKKHHLKREPRVPFPPNLLVADRFIALYAEHCGLASMWQMDERAVFEFERDKLQPALEPTDWKEFVPLVGLNGPFRIPGGCKVAIATYCRIPGGHDALIRTSVIALRSKKNAARMTEILNLIYQAWESLSLAKLPEVL